jgi:hypothetical protein
VTLAILTIKGTVRLSEFADLADVFGSRELWLIIALSLYASLSATSLAPPPLVSQRSRAGVDRRL